MTSKNDDNKDTTFLYTFKPPPRFSEYLRNSPDCQGLGSSSSRPFKPYNSNTLKNPGAFTSIQEHQKLRLSRATNWHEEWISILEFLKSNTHPDRWKPLAREFDDFYEIAKEFSIISALPCSDKHGNVEETGIHVLNLFFEGRIESNDSTLPTQKQVSKLKEYFGNINQQLINKSCQSFHTLINHVDPLTQSQLQDTLRKLAKKSSESTALPNGIPVIDETNIFPFGKFKIEPWDPCSVEDNLEPNVKNLWSNSFKDNSTEFTTSNSISNANGQLSDCLSEEDRKVFALFADDNLQLIPVPETAAPISSTTSKTWDRSYLLNLIGNQDILEALIQIITSSQSNDYIQDQLFDLLGFEKLDLITSILENRPAIVKGLTKEEAVGLAIRNKVIKNSQSAASNPVIGVKIQSAEEKMLEKIYRKEDKKAMKAAAAYVASGGEFVSVSQDEINLGNSMLNKISASSGYRPTNNGMENNPNIYDSYAEVKQKAGFISGQKIVLPENMIRKQTQECEEVDIPAEKKTLPKRALEKELIKISSLDPMGQEVFRGMKQLNRIQTIVFDTAYKTNENLLICAPTGAGKTNIALLSVLHCIKNNMEGNTILKNQFKIIYVAPMKALAAEMTANFSKRLAPLGILVRELTGDMQLTKAEITQTQMIVTTPEKWDVVTRKSTGDVALAQIVKLIIIDEVHLLHGDRGPVVESLVARTLRQVESSQRMIRIVGLSATLPNYRDVGDFLRVNPKVGLFYFDARFRPVPLGQTFIGVKALSMLEQQRQMDQCCYDKVYDMVSRGHQVMVFVHARNATIKTAEVLIEIGSKKGQLESFMVKGTDDEPFADYGKALKSLEKSRNKKLGELFQSGFSVHHAGLLRSDRNLVEKLFSDGYIKVLVCTATLAWGVNLPAHAVIIRGTEIYDAKQGSFVDLGILDVLQIFGRAGRPQFDTEGHGTIITTHDKLAHYLSLLTNQFPIESNFIKFLADNLNAEVALGSATNIGEAVEWLTYTYLYVRMRRNPQLYGMLYTEAQDDPLLTIRRKELIVEAARSLESARMIRFDERTENLYATDLGRTASHFYIKYDTIIVFNEMFHPVMPMDGILNLICNASEFEQLKVRDEELDELDNLKDYCMLKVWGGSENVHGKVSILIQTYISRGFIKAFSLMSDQQYVIQNAVRICRGFFEIVLRQGNPILAGRLLEFSKMLDQQLWDDSHPLRQHKILTHEILDKLEKFGLNIDRLRDMEPSEIGSLVRHPKMGPIIKRCVEELPFLDVLVNVQPITRNVLRVRIQILGSFKWNDRLHGNVSESFWIWVEDSENNTMYHHEYFLITKKQVLHHDQQELVFTIPITDPLPTQYYVRIVSDRFLGSQTIPVSFKHLILPEQHPPHTTLLDLDPLPTSALKDTRLELLYPFQFFNPIQTQIFHCLYHTDTNALIGAPTGSGKTIAAEMAMFRVFRVYPNTKVVYIAPLKALVRERMNDWKNRLEVKLNKKVVELTGDVTPDARAIGNADVIVTTPEKWDGISRSWQTRTYVQDVSLIIIDEIHLLGEDRGPVLEVIVSRTNYISKFTDRTLRVVGLSTALANARDLADWLGIKGFNGLFNFRPSVRPVPIQVHIQGFPGKHYCPRMATMNKPAYQAIREHSPCKPVLIFVSSRRQTRLTALDLIAYLAADGHPKQWIRNMDDSEMNYIVAGVKEPNLKLTLSFGIGIHHAGLQEGDRKTVEELFVNQKIQVLIATATLAWGVNFPAHLVVIKGTEYFDGKSHRYVDMPITDVLQMMGRAGRPQFDTEGVAVVLVHDQKKNFYKKFLYEPFPVESSLLEVLPDHINAEIVAGTINSNQEALDYLTYTYFFRRLLQNPSYYHLESNDSESVNSYLSSLIGRAFQVLENASCIYIHDDLRTVEPTSFGRIAGYYYLSHQTMEHFRNSLRPNLSLNDLIHIMTHVQEYAELPVRHNEDKLNEELAKECPVEVQTGSFDSPHIKAHLLLQSHFSRNQLPCSDYYTDLKSVLDQSIRILQAMIDACAENGWLVPVISSINLMQMIIQARWLQDDAFMCLPHVDEMTSSALIQKFQVDTLPELQERTRDNSELLERTLLPFLDQPSSVQFVYKTLQELPIISLTVEADLEQRKVLIPINNSNIWTDLPANTEFTLFMSLKRTNSFPKDLRVFAPKFSKTKDEGWFLVLGDIETQEVIALKRAGGVKRTSQQQLKINSSYSIGRKIYTLYLMSDSYLGIDYQYSLRLNFV